MNKLLVFHPEIAPYRVDFFNGLFARFDARLCFFFRNVRNQTFDSRKIESRFHFEPVYYVREEMGLIRWMMAIWRELSANKPDMVFVMEYGLVTLISIIHRLVTGGKYKIVSMVDDSYDMVANNKQFTRRHRLGMKIEAKWIDEIINVDASAAEWYRLHFGKGLYFPIIYDEVLAKERQKRVLPISERLICEYGLEGRKVLIFVGRLSPVKNIETAVRAFISADIPDSSFVIVGSGESEYELKEAAMGCDNIIFAGRYDGDELYAWYNIANVLVLPSIREPFGAVVSEALVSGCSAIVSDVAGSSCLVENGLNGFVVNPLAEEEYIDRMKALFAGETPLRCPLYVRPSRLAVSFSERMEKLTQTLNSMIQS